MINFKQKTTEWLRDSLTKEQYDYKKLAKELEVRPPTVVRWVKGTHFPMPNKFRKMREIITDDIKETTLYNNSSFNEKIFLLRYSEGLSIDEVAAGAMVYGKSLRAWEKGKSFPSDHQLRRLIQYYDVTPQQLGVDIDIYSFGSLLQEERLSMDYTRAELGEIIGRTPADISDFENESRTPTKEDIKKIANVFNVSTEYLILDNDGLPYEDLASVYVRLVREKRGED